MKARASDLIALWGTIGAIIGAGVALFTTPDNGPVLVPFIEGFFVGGCVAIAAAYLFAVLTDREW